MPGSCPLLIGPAWSLATGRWHGATGRRHSGDGPGPMTHRDTSQMSGASTSEELVVQAILDRLASRGLVPEVHGMTGTFQLDVEKVGTWYVVVDRERLTVSRAPVEV